MRNYFIIHGTFGHNKENWFPWLEEKLKEQGVEVFNLNYPTPKGQSFKNWSKVLDQVKENINEESVFICHSIGCIFLVKYCIYNNIKIDKCIFVSGCNNYFSIQSFDVLNRTMFTNKTSKFIDLCKKRICLYSKNDPYITEQALEDFANSLKADKVVYEDGGHFNKNSGYLKFEDILKYI